MTVGDRIKQRRTELGLTLEELAKKMGYSSKSVLAKYEKRDNLTATTINKFADALDCTPDYLMGWTQNPTTEVKVNENDLVNKAMKAFAMLPKKQQELYLSLMESNLENHKGE